LKFSKLLLRIFFSLQVSRPMFNSAEQALLFSSVPVGTLLGTLPITPLTSRFGMRFLGKKKIFLIIFLEKHLFSTG